MITLTSNMFTKIIMSIHSSYHDRTSVLMCLTFVIDIIKHYRRYTLDSINKEHDLY